MDTEQIKLWAGDFGKDYTDRNTRTQAEWDNFYINTWGFTKLEINDRCFGHLSRESKILEVGCNTGMQLVGLQRMGFENLYGIELQPYAVEEAKKHTQGINIIQGSAFDIPFRSNYFDLVITNGVLIHIDPQHHKAIMSEIHRCSSRYIAGFEYYDEVFKEIPYRGKQGYMWKGDFCKIYQDQFDDLNVKSKALYDYINKADKGNIDCMFLLEKS